MLTSNKPSLKTYRRSLRHNLTPSEAALWSYLKGSKLKESKFRRQHSLGNYILDFYCPAKRIGIELDGEVHKYDKINVKDVAKDKYLVDRGIRVLHFENKLIFTSLDSVLDEISRYL